MTSERNPEVGFMNEKKKMEKALKMQNQTDNERKAQPLSSVTQC